MPLDKERGFGVCITCNLNMGYDIILVHQISICFKMGFPCNMARGGDIGHYKLWQLR